MTGGTGGIGKECVGKYVELGATVVFTGRSQKSADSVIEEYSTKYPQSPKPVYMRCDSEDLLSLKSVADQFNKNYEKLDILLNNVGALVPERHQTKDNFDASFQVNHLGVFYITSLFWDKLKNTENSRVINVSSLIHYRPKKVDLDDINHEKITEKSYDFWDEYDYGKLLNVIFTKGLVELIKKENLKMKSAALSPGIVRTNFFDHSTCLHQCLIKPFCYPIACCILITPSQGAETSLHTTLIPLEELENGAYYD